MITSMPRIPLAVSDYGRAVEMFRDVFGHPVADLSDRTVPDLGAHVGMCVPTGGSNIELMAPANPDAPLSQSLQKFLDRRGDGPYALMLEAPDPNAEADAMAGRGIDVLPLMAGAGGRDLHPRSTSGVLIRVYPVDSVGDLSDHQSDAPVTTGITRAIIAVKDAGDSAKIYGHGLGLAVDPVVTDADRGVEVATAHPPAGGVIELVAPGDVSQPFAAAITAGLETSGPGLFALVLGADDPVAAAATLQARGQTVEETDAGRFQVTAFGTRFLIEASDSVD
jgi:catechol 2,3-dioxygenase-like lactoylglutathione lyase family enzyme